jgi:small-conductance mechanosensitive channel
VLAIISFIKTLAFDNISSKVIIFISAITAFFLIVQISSRIFPVIKRFKWLWYVQIIVVLILAFSLNSLFFEIFNTGEESRALIEKAGSTLLWLLGAYFVQQALSLFFWNGSYLKRHTTAPQGLLINLVSGALYLIAFYGILTAVFRQAMTGFLVSSSIVAAVVGLAMQDSITDIIAGIAISIEKPFRIGDWIETADGTRGEVVDVN